jgi:hypothetical protein
MESGGNDININPGVHVTNMHLGNLGLQSPLGTVRDAVPNNFFVIDTKMK